MMISMPTQVALYNIYVMVGKLKFVDFISDITGQQDFDGQVPEGYCGEGREGCDTARATC